MLRLLHYGLDPASRLVRLALGEYSIGFEGEIVDPWGRDETLLALNPAGVPPVARLEDERVVVGLLAIVNHIEDQLVPGGTMGLTPIDAAERAEMWRLLEWTHTKLGDEVTRYVLEEKVGKRASAGGAPDPAVLRVAKTNLTEHLSYFEWLIASRRWLAGESLSLADFALAAHLSCLDYLGDVDWKAAPETRQWYARLKSRPAFRPLLADRVAGMPPAANYGDLDF